LNALDYKFTIKVNWLAGTSSEEIDENLKELKFTLAKQQVSKASRFNLPKRLWQSLTKAAGIEETTIWADLNKHQIHNLTTQLSAGLYHVDGKSTFKEEFVTAGGVNLKEVNFKTFESKIHKNLF